jgi:hypothetical protein
MPSPHDPLNDPRPGDLDNNLLRKILSRLAEGSITVSPQIVIDPGDVEVGEVTVLNFPAVQPVSGTVDIGNLPATQPVSGTVGVSNFPATQPVSGTVDIGNLPATQPVSGTVGVSNFPATQPVSGAVSVSNFPASQIVSNPTDPNNPLFTASYLGLVAGKAAYSFHVMGRRVAFNSTSVLQDIGEWLGGSIDALPELTGAENLEVISSSAQDLSVTGSGARTIRVGYIDTSDNLVVSADIAMNGTNAVALAFKAKFILWMETSTAGNGTVAAGNISLRIAGAGATQEYIALGGNRSLTCRFMVPTGWTGYLVDWGVWSIGTTQDVRLRATVRTFSRTLGTSYIFQSVAYVASGGNSGEELHYIKVPALSRIKPSTIAGATTNSNRIDVEFTILLIQD